MSVTIDEAAPRAPASPRVRAGTPRRDRLRGWRLWALRGASLVLAPAVVLAVVELALRLAGSGHPTSFVLKEGDAYVPNERFAWRFAPADTAPTPHPFKLPAKKPANTLRVVVLGESAAYGVPDPAFSFPRILEVMLAERHPGVRIEVVNAAVMGINSHAILPIARDCASTLEPDAYVLYVGNNELCGFFGPMAVEPAGAAMPSMSLVRASLWARSTRLGQLLAKAPSAPDQKPGLKEFLAHQIPPASSRRADVAERMRQNLRDVIDAAGGKPVVAATVAVNLRDFAPIASMHRAGLAGDALDRWKKAFDEAVALAAAGEHARATTAFGVALAIDDQHAELQYRLGRSLEATGQADAARKHYQRAADLDTLPFRTTSLQNDVVRGLSGPNVQVVDVEQSFPHAPGTDLFYEHCHFRFAGNHAVAAALLPALEKALGRAPSSGAAVPTAEVVAARLARTRASEVSALDPIVNLYAGVPLNNCSDAKQRREALQKELDEARRLADAEDAGRVRGIYEHALGARPDDWVIRRDYGAFLLRQPDAKASVAEAGPHLEAAAAVAPSDHGLQLLLATARHLSGDSAEAERLLRAVIARKPKWPPARVALARLFMMRENPDQAIAALREGTSAVPESAFVFRAGLIGLLVERGRAEEALAELRLDRPDLSTGQAYATLGDMLRAKGQSDAAAAFAAAAPAEAHDDASFLNWHGSVLLSQSKLPDAERLFRRATERDPTMAGARTNLATVLLAQRRPDDAERELKAAIQAGPNAAACYMLGNLTLSRGDKDGAMSHFEQAVKLDPTHAPAQNNLATVLAMKGRTDEALPHLRACVARDPSHAKAHASLATILAGKGEHAAARRHFEQALACKERPNSAALGLAWLLATSPACTPDDAKLALKLAEEACEKSAYASAPALDALAAAHAAAGDFAKAARIADNLVAKTRAEGRHELSEQVARRAELYRQNKPYRQPAR